jgi:hypothetical protein
MTSEEFVMQFAAKINSTPFLLNILCDLDLLPEQVSDNPYKSVIMGAIVTAYEQGWEDGFEVDKIVPSNY